MGCFQPWYEAFSLQGTAVDGEKHKWPTENQGPSAQSHVGRLY